MYIGKIYKNGVVAFQKKDVDSSEIDRWSKQFDLKTRRLSRKELISEGKNPTSYEAVIDTVDGVDVVKYIVPSDFSYEILDVSSEYQEELYQEESKEALALVENLKVWIRATNKAKLRTGAWTTQKFTEFLSSPIIANAERALNQASLGTYKSLVVQAGAFYTQEEIDYVVALVDAHITKWQAKGVV